MSKLVGGLSGDDFGGDSRLKDFPLFEPGLVQLRTRGLTGEFN